MSDQTFALLLLADAHLGNPETHLDSLSVFDPLYEDITSTFNKDKSTPNLIVFCGDLAFGDHPERHLIEQYKTAELFLTQLCGCFGSKYGDIPIIIVPGNHDINRNLIDDGQKELRNKLTDSKITQMAQANNITWRRILERQKEWFDFARGMPSQPWKWDEAMHVCTGALAAGSITIGIAGFNSSWASHEEKEQAKLWIGTQQYGTAYQAIKLTDFKIAISHHPYDWLHEEDKPFIAQKMETQFNMFIHGHEHSQWFSDSLSHLKCEVGACYQGSKKSNGFSWLHLDFETSLAQIRLREYTPQGKGGWRANYIPGKTDENGIANLSFLKGRKGTETKRIASEEVNRKDGVQKASLFPSELGNYIKILEDRFFFRWERGNLSQETTPSLIYWPVRLRHPAPIHAAQCFVAAGLQTLKCHISLWIDDLGRQEYDVDQFIWALKGWFAKVGGVPDKLSVKTFSDILTSNENTDHAWKMLQKWLGTMAYFTDNILKISKIWPSTENPEKEHPETVLSEIAKRRPRRLMTPSMVWTCMSVLHEADQTMPIMTLGGFDEQDLWAAWRTCCGTPSLRVGHIYVPKLTTQTNRIEQVIHMSEKPLDWQSKEDIENEFRKALSEGDSRNIWSNARSMIPWTINNCALLPSFVARRPEMLTIRGQSISSLDDLKEFSPSDVMDSMIEAVSVWLL